MASKLVKCSNCNVVINEVLAFMQTKCDVMNEQNILQICATAFSDEEILEAKKMLFDSVSNAKRKIRRKEGKRRDLDDIICLLKSVDPEELPIFVARDLHRLPPITWDHVDVTRLLKDILLLQNEVSGFKRNYATKQSVDELCTDVANLKRTPIINNCGFVNRKRGAQLIDMDACDSGPMGLQLSPEATNVTVEVVTNPSNYCNEENILSPTHVQNDISSAVSPDMKSLTCCTRTGQPSADVDDSPVSLVHIHKRQHSVALSGRVADHCTNDMSLAADAFGNSSYTLANTTIREELLTHPVKPVLTTGESYAQEVADVSARVDGGVPVRETVKINENDGFVIVQRKQKRSASRFAGLPGRAVSSPSAKFKSADINIPLFINNVNKQTSEQDIINYIAQKTNTTISLKKINTSKKRNYNAYKVFVPHTKLQLFLNDGLWPEGVTYRRFVYIKKYDNDYEKKVFGRNENVANNNG